MTHVCEEGTVIMVITFRTHSDHLINWNFTVCCNKNRNFTVCPNKNIYLNLFLDSIQLYQCLSDRDQVPRGDFIPWQYHDLETFSDLLALCEGNPYWGESTGRESTCHRIPHKRPVLPSFDLVLQSFDLVLQRFDLVLQSFDLVIQSFGTFSVTGLIKLLNK